MKSSLNENWLKNWHMLHLGMELRPILALMNKTLWHNARLSVEDILSMTVLSSLSLQNNSN
jgi:hypothetical protein